MKHTECRIEGSDIQLSNPTQLRCIMLYYVERGSYLISVNGSLVIVNSQKTPYIDLCCFCIFSMRLVHDLMIYTAKYCCFFVDCRNVNNIKA